ncbi:MAG: cysteine desulfurase [Ignavibacteriota bacterium]|jgi:cysteine desulfurase/selenocysteine lyase|nr:MAG: cysteine desulfurase [Chlorobiota bacterium]MBE7475188.1 cysteine desulfurase [Ignavibacteriales bacterium]MBL1122154.1 cysteine desulfurase [Ignavibacteriota bacterium]MCC7092890.1 cysteine desulfurase [Ignavibacteriaceae bacterium]MCE7856175.1 cysteine desulfurase [Ignavibacteria bacterium CHB3]MEB2297948.1 cysteine desulfurase [Ignavibacteria bacterium]
MTTHAETAVSVSKNSFNVNRIREDFPILSKKVHGKNLVYLDNAATTQKPVYVIDKINNYYTTMNANIHRGVHALSQEATEAFESARIQIKQFINALGKNQVIFTRGTTEAINLVASSYGRKNIKEGDEIIISHMEHHSNIVPWQLLCIEKNAKLRVIPINDDGSLIYDEFEKMVNERTKFISIVYVSNSLGTINPIRKIIKYAHQFNIPVLVDAAQAVNHLRVDVQELDCDFLAFSGHKIYGPTGIGALYGKVELLDAMPPYQGGGDMISKVTFEETTYNELPHKFEAGTPDIAGAIGLGAAIEYVNKIGIENIREHEHSLLEYATTKIAEVPGLKIIGTAKEKTSVLSFVLENIHPHDIGTFLDFEGIAIRTGHHCTQPLMQRFNIPATSRASFAMYNTKQEIDVLINGLKKIFEVFG